MSGNLDAICPTCGAKRSQGCAGQRSSRLPASTGLDSWEYPPGTDRASFEQLAVAYYHWRMRSAGYNFGPRPAGLRQTIAHLERSLGDRAADTAYRYGMWMFGLVEGR